MRQLRSASCLVPLVLLTWGCGSDCDDTTRLDGEWEVYSRVSSEAWQVSGFDTASTNETVAAEAALDQADLLRQLFVNGTTAWTLTRQGETDTYALRVNGQEFEARMVPKKGACNALDLDFAGTWSGSEGSTHNFKFEGQLTFLGDEITGDWKYTDNFSWDDRDAAGTVAIPEGVFSGSRGASDTGG